MVEGAVLQAGDALRDGFNVLVVDDDVQLGQLLAGSLKKEGFHAIAVQSGNEAVSEIERRQVDLVFLDVKMPGDDGVETLRRIKHHDPDMTVAMMTAYGTISTAVEAMKCGAQEFLLKPIQVTRFIEVAHKTKRERLHRTAAFKPNRRNDPSSQWHGLLTRDPAMKKTVELIKRAAPLPSTVLIQGESGTGKELVAREIHERGRSGGRRFVAFNCAVIPAQLLESELFGYERGAFTGASARKIGYFEAAQGGTIFLDEIGEMSADLQAKLLRVIQEHSFRRLGGNEEIATDARIIAATNRDLEADVAAGRFRKDLYYRINVIRIQIPPLRRRPEDILLLSQHFAEQISQEFGKTIDGFDQEVLEHFLRYRWEGNVRELRNVVERAMAMASGATISLADLPDEFIRSNSAASAGRALKPYQDAKSHFEAEYLKRVMKETEGNVALASRLSGISRQHFYEKLARYNIERGEFRQGERRDIS